ncbi:hypothetical protein [Rhodopirellula sallentina]|uniref:Uncharacterized protein n=1 Tax=Rhodopirellula sallentina SM41 TaxID=1263870 RepID=M5U2G2_9BACT|nr:hypothetical protein [Rhodopirellula sallentina]EMI55647.1 hypothetical protein RSSM_02932 [Rhodopirellula sallentina SM41]
MNSAPRFVTQPHTVAANAGDTYPRNRVASHEGFAPNANTSSNRTDNEPTRGELIDDRFHPTPSASIHELPPEVLRHWGLLASPFSPHAMVDVPWDAANFYFRIASHTSAFSWLQRLLSRPGSLGVVSASTGAGSTTWLRQLAASSGLGSTAFETAVANWRNQSIDELTGCLMRTGGNVETLSQVRTLWLIQTHQSQTTSTKLKYADINRAALLAGWYSARANRLRNLQVLVVRKHQRRSAGSKRFSIAAADRLATFHLSRPHASELRRCVNAAMQHAGATRPAFTVSAATQLADSSEGSISRLASLVHAALVHGQVAGIRQITAADLSTPLKNHAEMPNTTSKAA